MKTKKNSFIDRLIEGYEKAKKPIAFILIFVILLFNNLPKVIFPDVLLNRLYPSIIIVLAMIIMQILFEIYEKVVKNRKQLNIITTHDLYSRIRDITKNEKIVSIKYIGVGGRLGWDFVLSKLGDDRNPDSFISDNINFSFDIALLDPNYSHSNLDIQNRFGTTKRSEEIQQAARNISNVTKNASKVNLYFYNHLPNMLGYLINDNYLFVTYAYFDERHGQMTLFAGGQDHFVYDKNDDFGGQELIHRFSKYFDYITRSYDRIEDDYQI